MTVLRLISFPMHAVVEIALGLATLAAPFALGFGPAGIVAGVVIGTLLIGLALPAVTEDRNHSVVAHLAADRGLIAGLAGSALVLALGGEDLAATYFAAGGLLLLALSTVTRYSRAL
jgi:hypothetical protein